MLALKLPLLIYRLNNIFDVKNDPKPKTADQTAEFICEAIAEFLTEGYEIQPALPPMIPAFGFLQPPPPAPPIPFAPDPIFKIKCETPEFKLPIDDLVELIIKPALKSCFETNQETNSHAGFPIGDSGFITYAPIAFTLGEGGKYIFVGSAIPGVISLAAALSTPGNSSIEKAVLLSAEIIKFFTTTVYISAYFTIKPHLPPAPGFIISGPFVGIAPYVSPLR